MVSPSLLSLHVKLLPSKLMPTAMPPSPPTPTAITSYFQTFPFMNKASGPSVVVFSPTPVTTIIRGPPTPPTSWPHRP